MQHTTYSYRQGEKLVPSAVRAELVEILDGIKNNSQLKQAITRELQLKGWAARVRISPHSGVSINNLKDRIGLCFQINGNMSRFYADMLKLQYLCHEDKIDAAVIILPTKEFAQDLNENIANFDRFTSELSIFKKIITVPIWTLGIYP